MTDISEQVARRLKAIRKEKGLTLEELADVCGVSRSMLGEIERGAANPTIVMLWKIAEGLKTPITAFLEEENAPYTLVRARRLEALSKEPGHRIYPLFPYSEAHKSELLHIELLAQGELANSGHRLELDETLVALDGPVSLELGEDSFELEAGDAIRFRGSLSHCMHNRGIQTVHLLNLLQYR